MEVDARGLDDWTPLHGACYNGRFEVARILLDHDASVNAENVLGEMPLHLVSKGVYHSEDAGARIAQLLLERGGFANAGVRGNGDMTPLHSASYNGKLEVVRTLLDHGAKPNVLTRWGKNPLDLASRCSHGSGLRIVQLLLEHGVDVNAQDKDHWTPLHTASVYGKPEIVRLLLSHGAKANAENDIGETPLDLVSRGQYTCADDGVRTTQLLLDQGANVSMNTRRKVDWTPIHWASFYGRLDIVRALVDHGATVNAKGYLLRTPLHDVSQGEYVSREDGVSLARLLLENGADVNAQDIDCETPLHLASCFGKIEIARVLLDHGANVSAENYDSETPLHVMSRGKFDSQDGIRLTQLLIERGIDANTPDKDHDTPLHAACYFGQLDIARELLGHGATATTVNDRGETPLHVLLRGKHEPQDGVRLARLLLENGADANTPNKMQDTTPLRLACYSGKYDVARLLLDHGAEANIGDHRGETPLYVVSQGIFASTSDGIRIAQLLLEHGMDVNVEDMSHRTPLHVASFHGCPEIVRVLLKHGASVDAKDDFGLTPLHLSSQYQVESEERAVDVARLLLEHGADTHALDNGHQTPMDFPSRRGWVKMAQLLLEHGTTLFPISIYGH